MKNLFIVTSIALLVNGCTSEKLEDKNTKSQTVKKVSDKVDVTPPTPCDLVSKTIFQPSEIVFVDKRNGISNLTSTTSIGAPGGKTAGATIKINSDCENLVSGKKISVSFQARSQDVTKIKAAYSTNEVGNSGCQRFSPTKQFKAFSFEYDVPKMTNGAGDYIGILPLSGSVEIKDVSLTIN